MDLVKALPDKLFKMIANPIAKEIPNYQVHSGPQFLTYVVIILIGAFIIYLLLDIASFHDKENQYEDDSTYQADTEEPVSENLLPISITFNTLPDSNHKNNIYRRIVFFSLIFIYIIFHLCYFRSTLIFSSGTNTLKKIEIVSPFIEDIEYKKLKSQFYTIESWNDYDQLDKKLNTLMEKEGLS